MKKTASIILLTSAVLCLTSCGKTIDYSSNLANYVRTMNYHKDFNILQLTDIHWNYNSSTVASRTYIDKVLKEVDSHIKSIQGETAKIDLIELTGDQFMLANTYHVDSFLTYFEEKAVEYGFEYAIIWGNHDHHGLYNPNWLSSRFKNAKHSIYVDEDDNLYGRSNFVIDLVDGTNNSNVKWQIANLDSGASFSETAISPFRDYDYIREDQTDWWLKQHNRVGKDVPSIAYYHIPQDENLKAWKDIHENGKSLKNKFFKLEGFADNGTEKYESNFIDVAKDNNLKGAFMGHAHNVDWTVEYEGVVIGLGVKTGPELYFAHIDNESDDPNMKEGLASVGINEKFDLIGASLVTLKDTKGNFDLEHLYLNERTSGDFVRWVKW